MRSSFLLLIVLTAVCVACGRRDTSDVGCESSRCMALRAQHLNNITPGPGIVPQLTVILDTMRAAGRDDCYFAVANVLVDRLFSDGRYAEADSMAVMMEREGRAEDNPVAMAMAHRVRGQMLYKLSQPRRAFAELAAARRLVGSADSSLNAFSTAASIDEWLWITARTLDDTVQCDSAALRYDGAVRHWLARGWADSTAHFRVSAAAMMACADLDRGDLAGAGRRLDSARTLFVPGLPARAYEHYYAVRSRLCASTGDYDAALAAVDTLLDTHAGFQWFYLDDLLAKAHIYSIWGRPAEAAAVYHTYVAARDSLSIAQVDGRLQDLSALYRSELDREHRRASAFRLIGVGAVALLLLALLILSVRNAARERRKNRLLVRRLSELDRRMQPESHQEPVSDIERLDIYMLSARPYTDPAFSRSELAAAVGMSGESVARIIRESRGSTVLAYINSYRLDEARRVLESDSAETLTEIATRLGFGTLRTFQRTFSERYSMPPSRYRALARENNALSDSF